MSNLSIPVPTQHVKSSNLLSKYLWPPIARTWIDGDVVEVTIPMS
ncbi:hypothetical protein [Paenibacillus polymyxa]|nr:hypothetical protein [Paenibacillus polymyxa]